MRLGVILILGLVVGCGEWPRVANVPKSGPLEPADANPGDLVQIDWSVVPESTDANELPTEAGAVALPLLHGEGQAIDGVLDGVGWADALAPDLLTDDNCPGNEGSRSPLGVGDYIADVDFAIVELDQSGTLCATLALDATSVGWDLVPYRADPCGIPVEPMVDAEGTVVGVDLGGASGGWAVNVDSGERVAIGLAGYAPNDAESHLEYTLALSIVERRADGTEGVCPTHPDPSEL